MAVDDLRSVRVEVDVPLGGPTGDAPELEPREDRGTRIGLLIAGVIAVALIVGAFGFARPATNEAADGTLRAPTTTVPDQIDADADAREEDEAARDEVPRSSQLSEPGPFIAVRAAAPLGLSSIVRTAEGFLGVAPNEVGRDPVYFSRNGIDWDPMGSPIGSADDLELDRMRWTRLENARGGLALTGTPGQRSETEIFVSSDGGVWNRLRLSDFAAAGVTPVFGFDNTVIGVGIGEVQPVDELLRSHTDIAVAAPGICALFLSRGEVPGFDLVECDRPNRVKLAAANALQTIPYADVVSCIVSLSVSETDGFPLVFAKSSSLWAVDSGGPLVIGDASGGTRRLGEANTTWNLEGDPVALSDRRIAFVDGGFEHDGSCAGAIDLPTARDRAVVVVDVDTGAEQRFEIPDRVATLGAATILGEIGTGDARHVLVEVDGGLEALHAETGRWLRLGRSVSCVLAFCTPIEQEPGSYHVSTSGQRVYQLNGEGLRVREFATEGDRVFIDEEFLIERDPTGGGDGAGNLDFAEIEFADDDVVFFRRIDGSVWGVGLDVG